MRLLIHAGGGKTGSTAIQTSFREGRTKLRAFGIDYPEAAGDAGITSGNGRHAFDTPETLRQALHGRGDILLSSEYIADMLLRWDDMAELRLVAAAAGYHQVSVLYFTRDPVSHAVSCWQQDVKRAGFSGTLEDCFATFDAPQQSADFIERAKAAGVEIEVRNYSRTRAELLAVTCRWMGLPGNALSKPAASQTNRSLTAGESAFCRALNRHAAANAVADALCERLPEIRPEAVAPAEWAQRDMLARMAEPLARINAALPSGEALSLEPVPPAQADASLSSAQIEVIADACARQIAALRARPEQLGGLRLIEALLRIGARRLGILPSKSVYGGAVVSPHVRG